MQEHFDVLVVGAGISGISAAYHIQENCPNRSYAILEGRDQIGGTWDLFRYPGIRSDSDMYTLGFSFKPWTDALAIADGPAILKYLDETIEENSIERHIRFGHKVQSASWSSEHARWTVEAVQQESGESAHFTCNFLHMCTGYYNYDAGYTPDFPGLDQFAGRVVHPQQWTDDIAYEGQRVVVIGSGATAVTLVPELAKQASHVTMLQRSPTYVVSRPAEDGLANWLRERLPAKLAYGITRWKNVLLGMLFFRLSRKRPEFVKRGLLGQVRKELGRGYDVAKHFTPRYNPWDQRICLVPNGDLFRAIREERASVVTDQIESFSEKGIKLKSGDELEADIVVTATGLDLQLLSDLEISVDGESVDPSESLNYKGMMYSGIPNLASSFGYTNASWTLKCDLTAAYVCRLLNHMESKQLDQCIPRVNDPDIELEPWIDFSSGYIQRAIDKFPKQGNKTPWKLHQNYALDIMSLRFGSLEDGSMEFRARPARP
jgi:monooxygenase